MTSLLRIWFQWGFLSVMASLWLAVFLLFLDTRKLLGKFRDVILIFFAISVCGNLLAWLILGALWRFSTAGLVVTGEKLVKMPEQIENDKLWQDSLTEA